MKQISENVKKNVLDLHYSRYLQYYTTTIIILFTYFVGLGIALLTKQIQLIDIVQLFLVGVVSLVVVSIAVLSLLHWKAGMQDILEEIKKLNL